MCLRADCAGCRGFFMKTPILLFAAMIMCWSSNARAAALTYVDLVNRLTDLKQLAVLPVSGEQCAQWSSYDRKSRFDASSGRYLEWDANGDGDGIIRKEGDSLVLAEIEGPSQGTSWYWHCPSASRGTTT